MPAGTQTFLVTGALGAIGAWTVRSLLDRGHRVVTFDLGGSDHRLRIALTDDEVALLTRLDGDVTDLPALERAIAEHEVTDVIHLAALQVPFVRADPLAGARVNVTGTVNVLEAVRRSGRITRPVVYASSIAALAAPGEHPSTLYGVFKRANEGTAERYFADYGVSSVGLRPHTVYGPGRDQGVTSAPTAALLSVAGGRPYAIPFGGALQMQYVADAGESFVRAGEAAGEGAAVHNLDGPVVAMTELIAIAERARPKAAGLLTCGDTPLPFPAAVDAASFVDLVGGPLARPIDAGVHATLERFEELLADGRLTLPVPA